MAARHLTVRETIPASRKLGADDARALLAGMQRLVIARGKKSESWDLANGITAPMVEAMLGPTGNLRAPTLQTGATVLVGFGDAAWADVFG